MRGCGNHGCYIQEPSGQGTNGPCGCDKYALRREIMRLQSLENEVIAIAETECLPNGDGVNGPTFEWAEEWARKSHI
mgnify:CR=1 FL=1